MPQIADELEERYPHQSGAWKKVMEAARRVALEARASSRITWHLWARFEEVDDLVRLGWIPREATLAGTPHGSYRLHCEWFCCCGREPPLPAAARDRARPRRSPAS